MEKNKFSREIYCRAAHPESFAVTIFLGIYNGSGYLDGLKSELLRQTNQNFHLVIVDNNSSDNSLQLIKTWIPDFPGQITIAQNQINLGGTGTLLNNFDLIKTSWFTAFHQDDRYGPNHIQVLLNEIQNSENDVIAVSTVMGSMDNVGNIIGTVPRASMFTESIDPVSAFLQNLRTHSVPWPASAFQCDVFSKTFAPWHSTAFPDTEQILRMCAYGRFVTIDEQTMHYRENQHSESHSIEIKESQLGVAISLIRFFNYPEFDSILKLVGNHERESFTMRMIDALEFRVVGSPFADLVIVSCLEGLIKSWGYTDPEVIKLGYASYSKIGAQLSSSLFARIGFAYHNISQAELKSINHKSISNFSLSPPRIYQKQKSTIRNSIFRGINRIFQSLPFDLKKKVFIFTIRLAQKFGRFMHLRFK